MSPRGGLIHFTQSFKGDFILELVNEYGHGYAFMIINKLRGKVDTISVDPASKRFETKEIERLDKKFKKSEITANIVLGFFGIVVLCLIGLTMYLGIKKIGWFDFFKNMFSKSFYLHL